MEELEDVVTYLAFSDTGDTETAVAIKKDTRCMNVSSDGPVIEFDCPMCEILGVVEEYKLYHLARFYYKTNDAEREIFNKELNKVYGELREV